MNDWKTNDILVLKALRRKYETWRTAYFDL